MAGFMSQRGLRSNETSPNTSFLVTKKLTQRRLPPIVFEEHKKNRRNSQPPPPPPTPAPWSWYHRNCSPSPKPQSRHHRLQHNISKSPKLPRSKCAVHSAITTPASLKGPINICRTQMRWCADDIDSPSTTVTNEQTGSHSSSEMTSNESNRPAPLTMSSDLDDSDYSSIHLTGSDDTNNESRTDSTHAALRSTSNLEFDNSYVFKKCIAYGKQKGHTDEGNITEQESGESFNPKIGHRLGTTDRILPKFRSLQPSVTAKDMCQRVPRRLPVPEFYSAERRDLITTDILEKPSWGPDTSLHRQQGAPCHQNMFNSRLDDSNQPANPFTDETTVVEMWCNATHEELVQKLPELVSTTLNYQAMCRSLLQESKMSTFLLQVAQAVFEEMVSLDQLIKKILEVAQHLVSADRASLFLVDHRNHELVSTVFDLRYESNNDSDFSKKEIRMPINKGIAGHVAMSGETMNIPDAYSDERFNKAVDEATGYRTVSILCMPIKVRGKVIAVVQMVNKRDKEAFENDDETAFQVFSTFFGLALHHARLYDKIKRKEQKYKVALEVLGYHNKCTEEDVINLLEEKKKCEKINYNDFALNPFELNEIEKCKGILIMFEDLFDITKFDVTVLARFVLTVKKNYRKVPYHNFDHGWAVANAMYVMLKHDTEKRFDFYNRLALFVACLCHDLDHRGYTNKFMSEIASPLAAVYTTSTLEHHHFNMTVTILQQDGHNIFYHMSSEEYKGMLDSIRQCILATDLAAFFPNLKKINELVFETPQFDWSDVTHSALGRSFSMTCADLCAAAKPFKVQLETVEIISAEFYQQGDLERQAGRTPIPMMDRSRPEELPASQVGFLSQICLPCYEVLCELFPATKPMLTMAKANLESWKARASAIEENNKNT